MKYRSLIATLVLGAIGLFACWDSATLNVPELAASDAGRDAPNDAAPPPATCAAPRAVCGGACVDLAVDPFNCGACGSNCAGQPPPFAASCNGSLVIAPAPPVCASGTCNFPQTTFDCATLHQICFNGNCGGCVAGYQDNNHDAVCTPDCATAALNCNSHGACSDVTGTAACVCDSGFTGANCEIAPPPAGPIVFVSSTTTKGNIGSLAAADAICQARATAKGLPGTFKALLSDGATSAATRLSRPAGSYKLVNGTVVANTANDLFSGTILAPLDRDEGGVQIANTEVWTGSNADGTSTAWNCTNWTTAAANVEGTQGVNGVTAGGWLNSYTQFCDRDARLYCVQQ